MMRIWLLILAIIKCGYVNAQESVDTNKSFVLDINNDAKKDTIIQNTVTNIFTFKYSPGKEIKVKQVAFFKNYNQYSVFMELFLERKMLRFELYFAPRFMHKDILWFKYDKQKDDWYLTAVTTHRDDPLPLLITDCDFITPKRKIFLCTDYYELVQKYTNPSAKYFLKKKCRSYVEQ